MNSASLNFNFVLLMSHWQFTFFSETLASWIWEDKFWDFRDSTDDVLIVSFRPLLSILWIVVKCFISQDMSALCGTSNCQDVGQESAEKQARIPWQNVTCSLGKILRSPFDWMQCLLLQFMLPISAYATRRIRSILVYSSRSCADSFTSWDGWRGRAEGSVWGEGSYAHLLHFLMLKDHAEAVFIFSLLTRALTHVLAN